MFFKPFSRSLALGATALALSLSLAAPARAELTRIESAELSMRLYLAGLEDRNPLLILAAAEMRKRTNFMKVGDIAGEVKSKDMQGGDAEPGPKTGAELEKASPRLHGAPVDWTEMLASARYLAAGDPALLALIEDVEAESAKGVTTGQVYSISEIDDGGEDVYDNLPFQAGEYAEVYVESADGSDLNLYIYDAAGRLVCSDTDISSISYCGWRPSEGGSFTIRVENRGQGDAGYSLMTN